MAPVWHHLHQHPDPRLRSSQRQRLQQRGHYCCAPANLPHHSPPPHDAVDAVLHSFHLQKGSSNLVQRQPRRACVAPRYVPLTCLVFVISRLNHLNVCISAGLLLFGLLSLLMDVFKIATYVGYLHCDSAVKVAFPVVQAVFLFVQVIALQEQAHAALLTLSIIVKRIKTCLF